MKQTSLFGTDASTYSQADSRVSPTQSQVIDVGKRTSDISGQRCLERLEKLNHVGSLAKTFTALLIGMTGWSSTRCKLTWKMKGTRFNRIYFQLRASTLPISEIESGLLPTATAQDFKRRGPKSKQQGLSNTENWVGMLPTPTASDIIGTPKRMETIHQTSTGGYYRVSDTTGTKFGAKLNDVAQLLPTPTTQEPTSTCELSDTGRRLTKDGKDSHSLNLGRVVSMGILPTPVASDVEGGISDPRQIKKHNTRWVRTSDSTGTMFGAKLRDVAQMLPTPKSQEARGNASRDRGKHNLTDEVSKMHEHDGTSSQLNPLFVEEMMGFPENWTLLPFLNGAQSPSKPTETP